VIGGSRGIGEATSKLLAVGGAEVWLTYHRGARDAEAVVADIRASGHRAEALACDAADPAWPVLAAIRPTHFYYFATPPIFSGSDAPAFTQFYVTAFGALVEKLIPHGLTHALYPSSVAVESAPAGMEDYAIAKAAGEALCRTLEKSHPGLTILAPRLPRLATDQTATFALVEAGSPADIMLPLLHQLSSP
jgi:NAD(P)-dependent dehydrogenase (short-subunit alcohol dehydrogenase family)